MADTEILASVPDIQAHLPEDKLPVSDGNTQLLQISIARIIRGYLSGVYLPSTMAGWTSPATTPDTIREVASRMIAAELYKRQLSSGAVEISDSQYGQRLYNDAMLLLERVRTGQISLPEVTDEVTAEGELTIDDFFPIDDTDRAFTMSMFGSPSSKA